MGEVRGAGDPDLPHRPEAVLSARSWEPCELGGGLLTAARGAPGGLGWRFNLRTLPGECPPCRRMTPHRCVPALHLLTEGQSPGPQSEWLVGDYPGHVILNPDCLHVFRSEYKHIACCVTAERGPMGVKTTEMGLVGGRDHRDGPPGRSRPQRCAPWWVRTTEVGPWGRGGQDHRAGSPHLHVVT